ncbi:FeoC-like transcriptional regulator [Prosthecochloris sp. HL-130-GSB]|jgi:predicted HTH transcriptional regulator|uniref:FeoC-like transcriptional regulator n=1 Tax=Prosthecochloris sp. HL-130-GSB TaxID=1974213 RepID=UPI000A1C0187|nr:FeoC-like transcriptional regulator [Prosthecochloris sp. HL-130-GSB]ARM31194.1 hypothetical protein B9H02_07690 [Prosthecochloris sp. HL-130-GSB]MBO8092530.1 hypothetical protein [Prosthecochloris sp.]
MQKELKSYLVRNKQVSLRELAVYFKQPSEHIEEELSYWINKGCIERKEPDTFASALFRGCPLREDAVFRWTCTE